MDKKFLDKVVDQIVSETNIDYEEKEVYVTFTTQSFHAYFPSLFRSYGSFIYHCKDVYGLNMEEIKYVWDKWEVTILDKIRDKGSINESTGMNKKFLNKVVDHIVYETKIDFKKRLIHFPFHSNYKEWQPFDFNFELFLYNGFYNQCKNIYGLDGVEIKYVSDEYNTIIRDKIKLPY